MDYQTLEVTVFDVWEDGEAVKLFDLRAADGSALPPFAAGAHIDITTPDAIRQYSLCNEPAETHRYVVGVALAEASRGGSSWLHSEVQPGKRLTIGLPRNHFPVLKGAHHSVLIAGGIGVTPLLAMVYELEASQQSWELHYTARSSELAPLCKALSECAAIAKYGKVTLYQTRAEPVNRLDLASLVASADSGSHFYCCGPETLIKSFTEALDGWPLEQVHCEHFSGADVSVAEGGFTIRLARSGSSFKVPEGETILSVLQDHKVSVPCACREGICGSCEIAVLDGIPDHRDNVLSEAEKQRNNTIMACCSGALSAELVLDI
ncbi:PDR/VanB family oxidoreductase [Alteromonas lipolytica]|uniref:Oxidoreductase n=1 Tax=Alteromonas lipolytica TaxID=1856405 RepID=A0A1E8FKP4_9ALTE|nr:PDR/VanB family oxidoreductase [Alteromonas lipolytica]OFI36336.1 hypothetical protein BFC17_00205 [Alteromonas lipolytica]GGF70716.1 ferredoxin:oxidoreductase FAD/NAD(P)-binding subunit [Alteromonas lipolytica]